MRDEMLSPAKADIIRLVKRRGAITIKEAVEELDLAASTIRQHLADLEIDGFIDKRINREGVGRPSQNYYLTEKSEHFFENHEGSMLAELIHYWISTGELEKIEEFFAESSTRWLATWEQRIASAPHIDRITHLKELLTEWGYIPEFDTDAQGRLIIDLYHCPYRNIADLVKFQCAGEKRLLEQLTGQYLCQTDSLSNGKPSCRFVATGKPAPSKD